MTIKKQSKTVKPRTLAAGWTVEPVKDLDLTSALNDISSELAKAIDEEIVKTIEMDHLVRSGWTKVELDRFRSRYHSIDIINWLADKDVRYTHYGSTFVFKEAKDATWFRMKWYE